ncbi:quinone-dependent dihydroorotate dehydrogenase [Methylacidiphilum caldifontis]|uniref:quinone-dependent dihydroorotate dehydrogenase n=1 Tax=Methylacidiphilum caldifontis TaxID=2795386 RepID=UPI001A8BFC1B|nr:quinone-dependent dihydroorotate dehydrogenase [Methylacidiphilum caldifontis]QSR88135.1 quinone-dependent dihydroorotate dehydrogenase [Methylacidiphilum caldifontis]
MIYRRLLRPLLFSLDPELAHHLCLRLLSHPLYSSFLKLWSSLQKGTVLLPKQLWGLKFPNPIGLAAGFDKNGIGIQGWEWLGFGFVEIGTVTPLPQEGNPRPRLFRLPTEEALWNSLGFPSEGAKAVSERLSQLIQKAKPRIPIGINIGKNRLTLLEDAVEDYKKCFSYFKNLGDFFVVNVSSPNTPGLRSLQQKAFLENLFDSLNCLNLAPRKPILVKVSADIEHKKLAEILEMLIRKESCGVVISNTLPAQGPSGTVGGISGKPLRKLTLELIRFVKRETKDKLPIIGVGGIFNAQDALEKLEAGADLLEVYTGFVYNGPSFPRELCKELARYRKDGYV